MVDCSHGNSLKDHLKQALVAAGDLRAGRAPARAAIFGAMLESHLVDGRQDYVPGRAADLRPEHHRRLPVARADGAAARALRRAAQQVARIDRLIRPRRPSPYWRG